MSGLGPLGPRDGDRGPDPAPRRIIAIEANMSRLDGALERDLYALDSEGHVWSFTFTTLTEGTWTRLPDLPGEEAA